MKEVHGGMGFRQNVGRIIGCFIILGLCVASPSRAQNVVLKIGTLAPEGSTWAKAFREVNKELEQ
jgi:TRAP-type C4-dicarboxylate transport system substrate-binding protein